MTGISQNRLIVHSSGWTKSYIQKRTIRSLFCEVQGDKNLGSEVAKVAKTKDLSLDVLNGLVSGF